MSDDSRFLDAIVILQSSTEIVESKVDALRYLKHFVENNDQIDAFNRKRINQLIIDNVMKIIIESSNQDGFRRQLVRVELFVLLSQILRSSSLFGAELTESVIQNMQINRPRPQEYEVNRDQQYSPPKSNSQIDWEETDELQPFSRRAPSQTSKPKGIIGKSIVLLEHQENSSSPNKRAKSSHAVERKIQPVESLQLYSKSVKLSSSSSLPALTLVKDALSQKKVKVELHSKLKPRPSVLFDDKLDSDDFVPGADPRNFLEQDRKLGYQKPRMWFPIPQLEVMGSISQTKKTGEQNPVVAEYLKMKSLASYVGDLLVTPSSASSSSSSLSATHKRLSGTAASKAIVDAKRYSHALREAMMLWTPILEAHRPKGSERGRKISFIRDAEEAEEIIPLPSSHSASMKPRPPRLFYEESVQLDERDERDDALLQFDHYQRWLSLSPPSYVILSLFLETSPRCSRGKRPLSPESSRRSSPA